MLGPIREARGVTLVELMLVVVIIAIIAAIAGTVYQDLQKKARMASDQELVANLRSAVAIYYGRNNGLFPASLATLNTLVNPAPVFQCTVIPTYDPMTGAIVHSITVADCP